MRTPVEEGLVTPIVPLTHKHTSIITPPGIQLQLRLSSLHYLSQGLLLLLLKLRSLQLTFFKIIKPKVANNFV